MMTLTLLNQIQSHATLSQHETTEFIQYLINPECHTQDKVKLLQAFTNKSIQQKELTYIVKSLIHTMYSTQPNTKEVYAFVEQEEINQIVSIFQRQYHL